MSYNRYQCPSVCSTMTFVTQMSADYSGLSQLSQVRCWSSQDSSAVSLFITASAPTTRCSAWKCVIDSNGQRVPRYALVSSRLKRLNRCQASACPHSSLRQPSSASRPRTAYQTLSQCYPGSPAVACTFYPSRTYHWPTNVAAATIVASS